MADLDSASDAHAHFIAPKSPNSAVPSVAHSISGRKMDEVASRSEEIESKPYMPREDTESTHSQGASTDCCEKVVPKETPNTAAEENADKNRNEATRTAQGRSLSFDVNMCDKQPQKYEKTSRRASESLVLQKNNSRRQKKVDDRVICVLDTKYDVVVDICQAMWKVAPNSDSDFDIMWCDHAITMDLFTKMKSYQKVNHFVGMQGITRKISLARNLHRIWKHFPAEYDFFPDTWVLPTDMVEFKKQFNRKKKRTFIIKPDNGYQGKGIFLTRTLPHIDSLQTIVAQRYLSKPLLLDGCKFDLRLYVLVTGCDPLRIFLHEKGLVRLATDEYATPSNSNMRNSMMHLTNYAINSKNPNFVENCDPSDPQCGHKRSWQAVLQKMQEEGRDVQTLQSGIEGIIIKTLIAVQPSLSHICRTCQIDANNSMCFEILGFDIMLDWKLKPWLIEVNQAPSFATETQLDLDVKSDVIKHAFSILNPSVELRRSAKRESRQLFEQRALGTRSVRTLPRRSPASQKDERERNVREETASRGTGYKKLYPVEGNHDPYKEFLTKSKEVWEMHSGLQKKPRRSDDQEIGAKQRKVDQEIGVKQRKVDQEIGAEQREADQEIGSKQREADQEIGAEQRDADQEIGSKQREADQEIGAEQREADQKIGSKQGETDQEIGAERMMGEESHFETQVAASGSSTQPDRASAPSDSASVQEVPSDSTSAPELLSAIDSIPQAMQRRNRDDLREIDADASEHSDLQPKPLELGRCTRNVRNQPRVPAKEMNGLHLAQTPSRRPGLESQVYEFNRPGRPLLRARTNFGWETVEVTNRYMSGKVDIVFSDGEKMFKVSPLIVRSHGSPVYHERVERRWPRPASAAVSLADARRRGETRPLERFNLPTKGNLPTAGIRPVLHSVVSSDLGALSSVRTSAFHRQPLNARLPTYARKPVEHRSPTALSARLSAIYIDRISKRS